MDKDKQELLLKWLVFASSVVIAGGGLFKYAADRHDEQEKSLVDRQEETRKEIRQPFYDKRLELYTEACKVCGILATTERGPRYDHALEDFSELYFGRLTFVEDENVADKMVKFYKVLTKAIGNTHREKRARTKAENKELQDAALDVASQCQDSIGTATYAQKNDVNKFDGPVHSSQDWYSHW